jgi:6-phosphofructokinase 1
VDYDAIADHLRAVKARGKNWGLIVVSEGAELPIDSSELGEGEVDAFGHKFLKDLAVGLTVAQEIKKRTGFEVRDVVLGHIQRGGAPTLFDRVLGTRVGLKAADLVMAGDFGKMVALQGTNVLGVPIEDAVGVQKLVSMELYKDLSTTWAK